MTTPRPACAPQITGCSLRYARPFWISGSIPTTPSANATFAAGVGFLHLAGDQPSARAAASREGLLDLMLRP
jgi:hypothetical protein